MRKGNTKRHIISLRVSTEEWDALQEMMKGLQLKRVSDLMREGFKELMAPSGSMQSATAEGQKRT
ncbi:MAG TPA: hypothetical protein DCZ75_18905 [Geobacter sp.]|nr:hypothetical protein [Geobacter sp.]